MGDFKNLRVWQKSKDLAVDIYKLSNENIDLKKDLRFKSQICSAAVSIASNIAEGDELMSNAQANRHFYIAKGSCAELITQIIIANEIGYISNLKKDLLLDNLNHISIMLFKLIKIRSNQ